MNICQSNTYQKDLSWLHFDKEQKVQKKKKKSGKPTVLHICFCILSNISK